LEPEWELAWALVLVPEWELAWELVLAQALAQVSVHM
jgi:hypothetical protein